MLLSYEPFLLFHYSPRAIVFVKIQYTEQYPALGRSLVYTSREHTLSKTKLSKLVVCEHKKLTTSSFNFPYFIPKYQEYLCGQIFV